MGSKVVSVRIIGDAKSLQAAFGSAAASASGFGSKLQSSGASIAAAGSKLTKGLTLPILALGAAAVKGFGDYEQSLNTLQAVSGASAKQMEQLGAKAKELGADMKLPGTSAADAAEAMVELAKGGLSVADSMDAAKAVLQLSAAAQISNAEAATITADALNSFGLAGKDAARVADLLAQSANATTADIDEMAQALKMSSAVAAQVGMPIEDLTTALGLLANAGIKGSDAGTSVKTMLLRLAAPTDVAAKAMKKLGFEVFDAHGKMLPMPQIIERWQKATKGLTQEQKLQAMQTIFGSDAIRAASVILGGSVQSWEKLSKEIQKSGAAQELATAKMKGVKGALEGLKSQAETAAVVFGERLAPRVEQATRKFADLVGRFTELSPKSQDMVIKIAGIAAAIGPVLLVVGKLTQGIGSLGGAFGLAASPLGLFALAIAGMAATSPEFRETLVELGKSALELGRSLASQAVPVLRAFGSILSTIAPVFPAIVAGILAYKAALIAATIATAAAKIELLSLSTVMSRIPFVALIGLAAAAGVAIAQIGRDTEGARTAFDDAADAVNGYKDALSGLKDEQGQVRDANLALEQSELSVQAAIKGRNSLLDGLTGKEREAKKGTLEYRQAQLAVKEAYAQLDRAEKNRKKTLDDVTTSQQAGIDNTRDFKQALLDALTTMTDLDAQAGLAQVDLEGWVDIAKSGSGEMKLWAGAALYLVESTGKIPKQIDIMTALADADTKAKITDLLSSLGALDKKQAKPKVDLDQAPYRKGKGEVETSLGELDKKQAKPKTFLDAAGFTPLIVAAAKKVEELDKKEAKPKVKLDAAGFWTEVTGLPGKLAGHKPKMDAAGRGLGAAVGTGAGRGAANLSPQVAAKVDAARGVIAGKTGGWASVGSSLGSALVSAASAALSSLASIAANAISGALAWARRNIGSTAEEAAAAQLGRPLGKGVIQGWLDGTRELPSTMSESVRKALDKAKAVVDAAREKFADAFSQLASDAGSALDRMFGKVLTKTEKLIAAQERAFQIEDLADRVASAQASLASAMAEGNAEAIASAQRDLQRALWEQERFHLEEVAAKERDQLEARQEMQKRAFAKALENLRKAMEGGHLTTKQAHAKLVALFHKFGIDLGGKGKEAGDAWVKLLLASLGAAVSGAGGIASAVNAALGGAGGGGGGGGAGGGGGGPAFVPPSGPADAGPSGSIPGKTFMWGGFEWGRFIGRGLAAFSDWARIHGLAMSTFKGNHPDLYAMLGKGGIVTAPTLAMMGEGRRREAVIPLQSRAGRAALAGAGAGTINFYFPNYLGDKRDLETEIRRALARTGRNNGSALGGLA